MRSVTNDVEESSEVVATMLSMASAMLREADLVTVVCHENPDADTLGGGLALADALSGLGIATEVVCSTGWPSTLAFLPLVERIQRAPTADPQAIVLVDCASIDRAGPSVSPWIRDATAPVINVDHHVSNSGYGAVNCIDRAAAATSEIVARLIENLGCELTPDMAKLLLAGILHDTDGLRVPETSASTLRLTAALVDAGADIGTTHRELFSQRPLAALHLWGRVASGLESELGGRVAIGTLTSDMLRASGAEMLDAEDLPELIASAQGAEVALLLREIDPDHTRVSIRTSGYVNAARLAMEFEGGGHDRAAGCSIPHDTETARDRLLDACRRHLGVADNDDAERNPHPPPADFRANAKVN
jgi:phosphoesterase RecJ-like protein